jgi:hypothetical protein
MKHILSFAAAKKWQNNAKTMALHAVATHFKYGIQRPPWQRHELSSVISLSFLDVYGYAATETSL